MRTTNAHVQYHWPEENKEKTEHKKTFTAQKGIGLRIQVPSELLAGEKQPLFAVLNGKTAGSGTAGDIKESFPFRWETSDPVIVYDVNNVPEDYRAPEKDEEIIASSIATAAHKIKQDTSALYLGDIATTTGGILYVRGVIENVPVNSSGEYDPEEGTETTLMSPWLEVLVKEEITIVDLDGNEMDYVSVYPIDSGEDRGKMILEDSPDALYGMAVQFQDELNPSNVDTITAWIHGSEMEMTETGDDTQIFYFNEDTVECTITLNDYAVFDNEEIDVLSVDVEYEDTSESVYISDTRIVKESGLDSLVFMENYISASIRFFSEPTSDKIDQIVLSIEHLNYPESRMEILTETGFNTFVFRTYHNPFDDTEVEITDINAFTASRDEIKCRISINNDSAIDDAYVYLKETDNESMSFTERKIIGNEDENYPDILDTNSFKVSSLRFPGIEGESINCLILSINDNLSASAIFDPAKMSYLSGPFLATVAGGDPGDIEGIPDDTQVLLTPGDFIAARLNSNCEDSIAKIRNSIISYLEKEGKRGTIAAFPVSQLIPSHNPFTFDNTHGWTIKDGRFNCYYGIGFHVAGQLSGEQPEEMLHVNHYESANNAYKSLSEYIKNLGANIWLNKGLTYESFIRDLRYFSGRANFPQSSRRIYTSIDILHMDCHGTVIHSTEKTKTALSLYRNTSVPSSEYPYTHMLCPEDPSEIWDYFSSNRTRTDTLHPILFYSNACQTAYDPTHPKLGNIDNRDVSNAYLEKWRSKTGSIAAVGWTRDTFTNRHSKEYGKYIYDFPNREIKDVVRDANEALSEQYKSAPTPTNYVGQYKIIIALQPIDNQIEYEQTHCWAYMRVNIKDKKKFILENELGKFGTPR